jgi:RNA polymerase sigma factor (TIGR02999 family)
MIDGGSNAPGLVDAQILLGDCYGEIRRIARSLVRDRAVAPFQPTELVHEAVVRMLRIDALTVQDRGHMLALAARIMRQSLIDEARRMSAAKRQPPLLTAWPENDNALVPLDVLDAALEALARVSADHAEIVELRFTLGMTVEEAAEVTGQSARTIKRRWQAARAWLQRYLEQAA